MDKELSEILKATADTDQMMQGVRQLAALVAAYRAELKSQGFKGLELLSLTAQFQTAIIAQSNQQGKGGV
jgi:hypothetical protein